MPENKLTDSEIVKALECCSSGDTNCCDECPLDKECGVSIPIMEKLMKYALALINRLQAENERLKPFEDKIAEFKSHIRVEDMLVFASSLEEWLEFCDNLKAEAYKEVFEKINEKAEVRKIKIFGGLHILKVVLLHDINELKHEMVGEDNA